MKEAIANRQTKLKLTFVALVFGLGATGCAPKNKNRNYTTPEINIEPRNTDSKLQLSPVAQSDKRFQFNYSGELEAFEIFKTAERMLSISKNSNLSNFETMGHQLITSYYSVPDLVKTVRFTSSNYLDAAIGETIDSLRSETHQGRLMLKRNRSALIDLANASRSEYPWPQTEAVHYLTLAPLIKDFTTWLNSRVAALVQEKIMDLRVAEGFNKKLQQKVSPFQAISHRVLPVLSGTRDLLVFIGALREMITATGLTLDESQKVQLDTLESIEKLARAISSEQDVLRVLIEIWELLPPAERKAAFAGRLAELDSFLEGKKKKTLNCLKQTQCTTFFLSFVKPVILQRIKKYGVQQAKLEISESLLSGARQAVLTMIRSFVADLPRTLALEVGLGMDSLDAFVANIERDIPGFILNSGGKWADAFFGKDHTIFLIETGSAKLEWNGASIAFKKHSPQNSVINTLDLGASMSVQVQSWQTYRDLPDLGRRIIEQINKVLVLGGYKTKSGELYRSYATSLTSEKPLDSRLNLRQVLQIDEPYAVPDRIFLAKGNEKSSVEASHDFSARTQAELLLGFSRLLGYTQDWKINAFDQTLGKIRMADLISEFKALELDQSLFPKDLIYTLVLGNAANILRNLSKDLSPLLLVTQSGEYVPYSKSQGDIFDSTLAAGFIDWRDGKPQAEISLMAVTSWIKALVEFYKATEGVEQTKSEILRTKSGAENKSPLEDLLESRKQVRNLILVAVNFLNSWMRDKNGFFVERFNWREGKVIDSTYPNLLDQVDAMEALLAASQIINPKVPLTVAVETYFSLNRSFFSDELRFYAAQPPVDAKEQKALTAPQVIQVLDVLIKLKEFLPQESQEQLEEILRPWLRETNKFQVGSWLPPRPIERP
jgi:hypothetical protein